MSKKVVILFCAFILSYSVGVQAEAIDLHLSVNRLFLQEDTGYLGKMQLELLETQGFYLEMLQIGDYYSQLGGGIEVAILNQGAGRLWLMLGQDKYTLGPTQNTMLRTGLLARVKVPFGECRAEVDLMLDELIGNFIRYQLEVSIPGTWLKGNIGAGNVLGSGDGYALWAGFEI